MTSPTGDTPELAGRLRAYAATFDGASTMYASHPAVQADEAAAALTTLGREREEARASNSALMAERTSLIETKHAQIAALTANATVSQAEVERLRDALTKIAAYDDIQASQSLEKWGSYGSFDEPGSVEIARAALHPQVKP